MVLINHYGYLVSIVSNPTLSSQHWKIVDIQVISHNRMACIIETMILLTKVTHLGVNLVITIKIWDWFFSIYIHVVTVKSMIFNGNKQLSLLMYIGWTI